MKTPSVYILAGKRNGTLYIGVTSDLVRRVWKQTNGDIGPARKADQEMAACLEGRTDPSATTRTGTIRWVVLTLCAA